jgi:polyphosphate kinase
MDYRVEVSCPIYDEDIKNEILETFMISWNDNVKARVLSANQDNAYREKKFPAVRSQYALYEYYEQKLEEVKV